MEQYPRLGPLPEQALAILMGMRAELGITRLADLTGLDRIGIPILQVTRPFSFSNAVSLGKGVDATHAAVSALLESAECFFAERIDRFKTTIASAHRLDVPAERFEKYLRYGVPRTWHERETAWTLAENVIGGSQAWVPLELVHTAYLAPPSQHDDIFWGTTTGLAAAFHEADAVIHGILECVERDAISRANRTHGFLQRQRIDPATIDDPLVVSLLDHLAEKNFAVGLWLAPSPTGIPVVSCHVMEMNSRETALLHSPSDGSAAAFYPAGAIASAIYEAVQARLAAISGARDDITRVFYRKYPDWELIADHLKLLCEGPTEVNFADMRAQKSPALPGLVASLESCGIRAVYLVRLDTSPLERLSAVRIVIPQLDPLLSA